MPAHGSSGDRQRDKAWPDTSRCIDIVLSEDAGPVCVAFALGCGSKQRTVVRNLLDAAGHRSIEIDDAPGMVVARTIAMLVNEAADAVQQGVCDEASVDIAMKLGTNYPLGPFEWLARLGAPTMCSLLDNLDSVYRGERYRASSLLRRRIWVQAMEVRSWTIASKLIQIIFVSN